jgi:hypothetical protein
MNNQDLMRQRRQTIAEQKAWIHVAVEAFKELDNYLRTIDPSLPRHYGMPVDGVRRVIESIQGRNH